MELKRIEFRNINSFKTREMIEKYYQISWGVLVNSSVLTGHSCANILFHKRLLTFTTIIKNMTDLGEIYKEFLGGFQPKFSEIVSKYGKDRVFDNIELCGGAKITPNHRTVRMVAIPLDRERYEPGGDLVFLETSTSPKSNNFKYPGFEKGDIDSSVSWHPGDVPPEERSA